MFNITLPNSNLLVGIDTLDTTFEKYNSPTTYTYKDQCNHCERDVEVRITKTSEGYGFHGGALCESQPLKLFALCLDCYEQSG